MKSLSKTTIVLEQDQPIPAGVAYPPRQPKWSDTFSYIANPEKFCQQNLARYGPIFNTAVFGKNTLFVGSPQAIEMAFNGDGNYTEIALPSTTMDMFGEFSLFQRPDLHQDRKKALRPGLSGSTLAGYIPQINQTISQSLQQLSPGKIALYPMVEQISFKVLVPLLLGVNLEDINKFPNSPFSTVEELKACYQTYFNGFYGLVKWKSPLTAYGRGWQARAKLLQFMRAVIQQRRSTEIEPSSDFLAMMLASQRQNPAGVFSDSLIENQCLLQLWASHYEISGLLASLCYQVGNFPQVLTQLRTEQLGTDLGTLERDNLVKMDFLEAVIKETLRILPPSSTANRRLTKTVIVDNLVFPTGFGIIAEPRLAHIIPEHFPQPENFEPERFLSPRSEGKMYQYIPFGGGVHACLGAQMALVVGKIFMTHFVDLFDWQLQGEPSFVHFPIKRIKDNYQIILQRREIRC